METFIFVLVIIALIGYGLEWIFNMFFHIIVPFFFHIILPYVILPIACLSIIYFVLLSIYHKLNPAAKKAYLAKKKKCAEERAKFAEELKKEKAEKEAAAKKKKAEKEAAVKEKNEREAKERYRKELERQQHRDGDQQLTPYVYQIGKHGNESLAIRYGIANQEKKIKEYWFYAKGGEKRRNPDRDIVLYEPAATIRLQKTKKISKDLYEVLLTDYRERKARAIIEVGTEYVKTFYPLDDNWFVKHATLEETLKGNNSFTLKELATFHIQKTVGN